MPIDTTFVTDEDAPLVIDVGPPPLFERASGTVSLLAGEDDQFLTFTTVDEAVAFLRANVSSEVLRERRFRILALAFCNLDT